MLLQVEQLSHVYMPGTPFETAALKDINLHVSKGEFLAVIGETGSGKSTLVQHLNGLLKPTSGRVLLDGREIGKEKTELAAVRRRIGLLFQFPEQQLFEETVYEDVAFGPRNLGLSEEEVSTRVEKSLRQVGLDPPDVGKRSPFLLSGGQMRRVAMAGVLAMGPDVIILDEPAAGLDPRGKSDMLDMIVSLHRNEGLTVILVSHSMEDVARLADRLIVLTNGEISLSGSPREVFSQAEKLDALGLSLPQVTLLMHRLRQAGKDVPTDIFTVERARDAILTMLGG